MSGVAGLRGRTCLHVNLQASLKRLDRELRLPHDFRLGTLAGDLHLHGELFRRQPLRQDSGPCLAPVQSDVQRKLGLVQAAGGIEGAPEAREDRQLRVDDEQNTEARGPQRPDGIALCIVVDVALVEVLPGAIGPNPIIAHVRVQASYTGVGMQRPNEVHEGLPPPMVDEPDRELLLGNEELSEGTLPFLRRRKDDPIVNVLVVQKMHLQLLASKPGASSRRCVAPFAAPFLCEYEHALEMRACDTSVICPLDTALIWECLQQPLAIVLLLDVGPLCLHPVPGCALVKKDLVLRASERNVLQNVCGFVVVLQDFASNHLHSPAWAHAFHPSLQRRRRHCSAFAAEAMVTRVELDRNHGVRKRSCI
mmetsp:Transcript_33412/g.92305  ORF Transcript_33412/g.92305 Transcript_33412/m.92305 type:complete len:365 (+) Transcript_33412:906-2000(+)